MNRPHPCLGAHLEDQLSKVQSADGLTHPCSVIMRDGKVIDRVYFAEAETWFVQWGVWPEDDPGKTSIDPGEVAELRESPSRLPVQFASKLYEAGESGMGYTIFTLIFRDGSRAAFVAGNAIDFIDYPVGQSPATVVDAIPHVGRGDPTMRTSPSYAWCLYR